MYSAIAVEPTKLTAAIPRCCRIASTASLSPLTTLNTPGGSPASDVRHLLPLLQVLRLQPYGVNEPLWKVRPLHIPCGAVLPFRIGAKTLVEVHAQGSRQWFTGDWHGPVAAAHTALWSAELLTSGHSQ